MFQIRQKAERTHFFLHLFVLFGLLVEWMSPIHTGEDNLFTWSTNSHSSFFCKHPLTHRNSVLSDTWVSMIQSKVSCKTLTHINLLYTNQLQKYLHELLSQIASLQFSKRKSTWICCLKPKIWFSCYISFDWSYDMCAIFSHHILICSS